MRPTTDLLDLADQVARLSVSRHDPERFFIDRSEIAHRLRRMARVLSEPTSLGAKTPGSSLIASKNQGAPHGPS